MPTPTSPRFPRPLATPQAEQGRAMRFDETFALDCGRALPSPTVAYMTYGRLNPERSNAILVCHALSGDQFVAGVHPVTGKSGWWPLMVGPGRPIDTDRFFVIAANALGGCMGTTGPADIDPATGKAYGLSFPLVTLRDMARLQAMLLDALGVERLLCVTGGSMGGMQALEWAALFPDRIASAMPIATAARHTAQNIALHEIGRQAIMADPNWRGGAYQDFGVRPSKGLAVARMVGHVSYLSEAALERKFGRRLQDRGAVSFAFEPDFQVESYLHHQGSTFVERFDANSYLYITRAMDYFDLAEEFGGALENAFRGSKTRFQCISFTSDWLFPTAENLRIVEALRKAGAAVEFAEIATDRGHDAFLLDEPELFATVRRFLDSAARRAGLG
ncbi:MAG TPA: homoserine O-acetyltransferase [Rhizomicrobium sp.]|nr:homoserine O-acetyltransferase [Rhizomicrobium sp.]